MIEAAKSGDQHARKLVDKYQHRPPLEFYDVANDPLELHNLADQAKHRDEIDRLKTKLAAWMKSQGDQGIETELAANLHVKKKKKRKR